MAGFLTDRVGTRNGTSGRKAAWGYPNEEGTGTVGQCGVASDNAEGVKKA